MPRRIRRLVLCICTLLLPVVSAQSQTATSFPPTLNLGDRLQVRTQNGKRVKGVLAGISSEELTISRGNKSIRMTRADVERIHLLVRKSPAKHIALGAAIGLGAFLAAHAISLPDEPWPTHSQDPKEMAQSAGIGAVVG